MNLNRRQRSRSETRGAEQAQQHLMRFKLPHHHLQLQQQQYNNSTGTVTGGRRKTSAELISEAKSLLNAGGPHAPHAHNGSGGNATAAGLTGVRLVSTRRPVTPREAGRALYGNVTLAGRPPSAFSMRYLQNETQRTLPKTPNLAPIYSAEQLEANTTTTTTTQPMKRHARRSHSLGSTVEFCKAFGSTGLLHHSFDADYNNYNNNNSNNSNNNNHPIINHHNHNQNGRNLLAMPRKLPALEIAGLPLNGQNTAATSNAQNNNNNSILQQQQQGEPNDVDGSGGVGLNLLSSRRLLKRNCDVLAQSSTQKLIELLKEHAGLRECTDETANHVHAILTELYGRVRKQEKRCKRAFILGGLYGLVEATSPKILLAVAKVVLALRVTGSNLTGACKLIYKVARSEQNDHLFHDNDVLELLVEGLGRASPLDDPEACIYGYGAIRFLTSSSAQERDNLTTASSSSATAPPYDEPKIKPATAPAGNGTTGDTSNLLQQRQQRWQRLCKQSTLVQRMARHGAVQLMVLHLQLLNEAGAMRRLSGPPLHSLYQLAAALRALADVRQTSAAAAAAAASATGTGTSAAVTAMTPDGLQLQLACAHLVRAAEISIGEVEVQANIVRTLSALSEDEDCCLALVSATGRIGMLLGPCCELFGSATTGDNKPLSVLSRFGYILGNLMAKYDQARLQFFRNDVAMEFLLDALRLCCSKPLTLRSAMGDSVLDVLVKLIRVVANMSVNPEVGCGLGGVRDLGALLIGLLHTINARQRNERVKSSRGEMQELTHATLGALHNLCFYQDDDDDNNDDGNKQSNGNGADTSDEQQQCRETSLPTGCLQSVLPQLANALYATLRNSPHNESSSSNNNNDDDDDDDDDYDTIQMEAVRVLGNLTRNALARQQFCRCGGISLMLQRLAHYNNNSNSSNRNNRNHEANANGDEMETTRACAIGVLVNLLGDEANRAPFMRLNGMQHLLHALSGVLQQRDWRFAAIICQAFWNLLTTISTTPATTTTATTTTTTSATTIVANRIECGTELLDELCDQLADHLDEESLFAQHNGSGAHAMWEDFAIVAADLLERIQQSLDDDDDHDDDDGVGDGDGNDDYQHNGVQRSHNHNNHNNNNRNHNNDVNKRKVDTVGDDDDDDEADVCMENL